MVKFASTLFISALVAAPAFAAVINVQAVESRDLTDQAIFGRDLTEAEATQYAREFEDLVTREPEDELEDELEARSFKSFFRKIWHGVKKVFLRREDELEEIDDLAAREFDDEVEEVARDEFEDPELVARDFEDDEEMAARELDDELYERDFEVDEDLMEREVEDLEQLD